MENKSTYSDFLRQENEITKLKIQAEFGLEMHEGNGLNPAIENIWLKHILEYERAMAKSEEITVREKLGNPEFTPAEKLNDDDIIPALHELMEKLHSKNIVIDSLAGVSDREMYRFVTEELFEHKTDKNTLPNSLVCFIYEEFHPNHEYDIRRRAEEMIEAICSVEKIDFEDFILASGDDEVKQVKSEIIKRKLSLFKNAFDDIKSELFEIKSIIIFDDIADVQYDYTFSVLPAESKKRYDISGTGNFRLENQFGWWWIVDIDMKGVV